MAQRTSQGVMDGGGALPSGTAQPALLAKALGRCNPDQRAPSPALAKEDVLYATRPKPPAQRIRATRSPLTGHSGRPSQWHYDRVCYLGPMASCATITRPPIPAIIPMSQGILPP